jgi:hypothetical protein
MIGEKIGGESGNDDTSWDSLRNIEFDSSKVDKIVLSDSGDKFGAGRNDKDVVVEDDEGNSKRTSSIMMGKKETSLEDGTYINAEGFKSQLSEQFGSQPEGTTVMRMEPPKEMTISEAASEIVEKAQEASSSLVVENNDKIANQDGRSVYQKEAGSTVEQRKGIFMLGNNKIEFSNGEYISEKTVREALSNYMFKTKEKPEEEWDVVYYPPTNMPEEVKDSSNDRRRKLLAALLLATALGAVGSIVSSSEDVLAANNIVLDPNPIVSEEEAPQNPVDDLFEDEEKGDEIIDEDQVREDYEKQLQGVDIGDTFNIPSGVLVHESSDYQHGGKNAIGVVFNVQDEAAGKDYTIQSFSVLDPVTHEVINDNVTWTEGTNLGEHLEAISARTGHSVKDLAENTKIHIGEGESHFGWADYSDIVNLGVERIMNE